MTCGRHTSLNAHGKVHKAHSGEGPDSWSHAGPQEDHHSSRGCELQRLRKAGSTGLGPHFTRSSRGAHLHQAKAIRVEAKLQRLARARIGCKTRLTPAAGMRRTELKALSGEQFPGLGCHLGCHHFTSFRVGNLSPVDVTAPTGLDPAPRSASNRCHRSWGSAWGRPGRFAVDRRAARRRHTPGLNS